MSPTLNDYVNALQHPVDVITNYEIVHDKTFSIYYKINTRDYYS